jgi:hypothetical protein
VTCGGGGGGGGGGGAISGIASAAAGFAAARCPPAGGGGGTDSPPEVPPDPPDPAAALGVPGPTSISGAAFELSSCVDFAAFAVVLSTLPKIDVIESLTFFPAALPMALPAADAPISVIV